MANPQSMVARWKWQKWQPSRVTLIAAGLVVAGFLLASVSWWYLLLVAAGTFGPGILRELGWLRDQDEFQRRAAHRAGYHAYLTAGAVAFILVAHIRSAETSIRGAEDLASLLLAILWFTWFLSSLVHYWGKQTAAARILVAFGGAWLIFTIASNVGSEWTGWKALLLHPLLTLPFFVPAWLSFRWPRLAGILLLGTCVGFAQFFGIFRAGHFDPITQSITTVLFLGPLLASGVALVTVGKDDGNENDRPHAMSAAGD